MDNTWSATMDQTETKVHNSISLFDNGDCFHTWQLQSSTHTFRVGFYYYCTG